MQFEAETQGTPTLIDPFGRQIDYVRVSVTDRCDFRCFYCMAENMHFLPKKDILSLEELDRLCSAFVDQGVRRLRLTGGEPLVRKGILTLISSLSRHLDSGALDELTLTTNGSQLKRMAPELAAMGVKRINLSLDSLREDRFHSITRWGKFGSVMEGIEAALAAGIKLKLNMVALKGVNDDEFDDMIRFCHARGMDLTIIETMPLGEIDHDRLDLYLPLDQVKQQLAQSWTLSPSRHKTGGPATYMQIAETGGRIGFITPLTHNFCESCNRVRITCTGTLYMCLGQEDAVDLRAPLRASESNDLLVQEIRGAIARKPLGHDFVIDRENNRPSIGRHMSVTGG
ncbi:cyclic pyranopterin phosphate synthase [Cohaesibacter sp. ES.047]|uniref:GTP 3',8-cyclase MoaA n=1 Tax=Cohaesibacter sp. ES.047 TaxID=1798205 RepID=UPI000BB6C969|nr:GTP 3',8-cyclase MoaA [Cohaesibacter sp. ES.047]SNY93029.1 cyclic pyranopterin phosphate synthase [Cohaesibacter sp. ES.047]